MAHLLEGKNLYKTYREKAKVTPALSDVSFYLDRGEILGIVGESGSGKSTLLKAIAGMLKLDQGSVFYNGKDFTGMTPRQTGAFLQMIFQDANSSFDPRRVMKKSILESGRGKKDEGRILELVSLVGLEEDLLSRKPSSLSGGQCQRMAIARAFYSDADIEISLDNDTYLTEKLPSTLNSSGFYHFTCKFFNILVDTRAICSTSSHHPPICGCD